MSRSQTLNICVIGCGIGGLAAATLLSKRQHNVVVLDQFEKPSPVGSGLVIQPVGQFVLRATDADTIAFEHGAKIRAMSGHEVDRGRHILNVSYGKNFGLAIHRSSLFNALYKAALANGASIQSSSKVSSTSETIRGRMVHLENGGELGPFDLVINASGAKSSLSPIKRTPLKYGAIWGTVDWPENTPLSTDLLTQSYQAASTMAGVLPIGTLLDDPKPKAAIFWSLRSNDYDKWKEQPIDRWKERTSSLWPEFAPFVEQVSCHEDMTMARYSHGTLRENTQNQLVHIGDAAHCASPQLGQGANMAMLDALALSVALERHALPDALTAYAKSRRLHVQAYQMMSWALTPMYQSDSKILPWIRDWILGPLSVIPPFPYMMTKIGSGDFVKPIRKVQLSDYS